MQIVIDIPEHIVKAYQEMIAMTNFEEISVQRGIIKSIANGKPLPKGHGRIIDENKITQCEQVGLIIKDGNITRCIVTDAPTIIEADKTRDYNNYAYSDGEYVQEQKNVMNVCGVTNS